MGVVLQTYLLEGSLSGLIERRRSLIERMAETLLDNPEGLGSDNDAVRILQWKGYKMADVAILAGEARMVAYQTIVAKEMSEP
jgi:hypothetical protein